MKRFALTLFAGALLTPAPMAHESNTQPAPKLPSADEIAQMQAQMPDFNKLMSGLKTVMEDEALQASMTSALDAMSQTMGEANLGAKSKDGMPDLNAMMGAMLSMMGEDGVMGDMLTALEPVQQALPKIMEDAMPKAGEAAPH